MVAKEIFVALAKYKASVDGELLDIVAKLGEDKLLATSGAYFPTLYAQLKHVFGSDVNWFKRLKAALPGNRTLAASRFSDYDLDGLKALPMAERGEFYADMRELDAEIAAFVSGLREEDLPALITYKDYKGQEQANALWKCLLHWFNHGVHHRGTISGQLDALGVDNDYSGLINRI